ncbi:MAG: tyrosine-type recombinase/integrase [Thermoplasmatota archaeon]
MFQKQMFRKQLIRRKTMRKMAEAGTTRPDSGALEKRPLDGEENEARESGATRDNTDSGHGGKLEQGGAAVGGICLTEALRKWELWLASKAGQTQTAYRRHVRKLLELTGKRCPGGIKDEDVMAYLNTLGARSTQEQALAAIKAFMRMAGRTVTEVNLKRRQPPKPITELTEEELDAIVTAGKGLEEKAFLGVMKDTGARINAVCHLRTEDVKLDHVVLKAEWSKARIETLAPITDETSRMLKEYILHEYPKGWLFGDGAGKPWSRQKAYRVIQKAAKRAGIRKHIYPHLFRHLRALAYRRAGTEPDVVVNAMGWTDTTQYNKRYGKRTAHETLREARRAISFPATQGDIPQAIKRLADLLEAGMIDRETFQAGLLVLGKKDEKKDITGYL